MSLTHSARKHMKTITLYILLTILVLSAFPSIFKFSILLLDKSILYISWYFMDMRRDFDFTCTSTTILQYIMDPIQLYAYRPTGIHKSRWIIPDQMWPMCGPRVTRGSPSNYMWPTWTPIMHSESFTSYMRIDMPEIAKPSQSSIYIRKSQVAHIHHYILCSVQIYALNKIAQEVNVHRHSSAWHFSNSHLKRNRCQWTVPGFPLYTACTNCSLFMLSYSYIWVYIN